MFFVCSTAKNLFNFVSNIGHFVLCILKLKFFLWLEITVIIRCAGLGNLDSRLSKSISFLREKETDLVRYIMSETPRALGFKEVTQIESEMRIL